MTRFTKSINDSDIRAEIDCSNCLGTGSVSTSIPEFGTTTFVGANAPAIFAVDSDSAGGTRIRPLRIGVYLATLTAGVGPSGTIMAGVAMAGLGPAITINPNYLFHNAGLFTMPAGGSATYNGSKVFFHRGNVAGVTPNQIAALISNGAAGAPADLVLASATLTVSYLGSLDPG